MSHVSLFVLPMGLGRQDLLRVRAGTATPDLLRDLQSGPQLYLGQVLEYEDGYRAGGPTTAILTLLGPNVHVLTPDLIEALSAAVVFHNFSSIEINMDFRGAWSWLRKHEGRVVFTGSID